MKPSRRAPWRPTRAEVAAAEGTTVPDVIRTDLDVLLVGINPGLYSGAVGHHFARPGNRFWKALHGAGFTPRLLTAFEGRELLGYGVGITNIVGRATATADALTTEELRDGARAIERKACRWRPGIVAFLGVTAYRTAFDDRRATIGPQERRFCESRVWVLPNPSGRTAAYQLGDLISEFKRLRTAAAAASASASGSAASRSSVSGSAAAGS
jgi:TDG/mug DNA glycosylase family protein